jgi:cell division protein FtsQ
MWDNAPLLRYIANTMITGSLLAMLYGAIWYWVHLPGSLPLRSVQLSAAPKRVAVAEILAVVQSEIRGNFFTVDIERLRTALEKLAWVRSVSIWRKFPQGLMVQLEEHQALARWNDSELVNVQGELFQARSDQVLPEFFGQEKRGDSFEIAKYYSVFSQQLAALGISVSQLALSPRHAWQMHLSNGMVLELGREDAQQRLARFVAVYPYSLAAIQKPEIGAQKSARVTSYVDLRYRNGFAVKQAKWNAG